MEALAFWRQPRLRVCFVCSANVCRSPLAEAMLRHRLHELGLAHEIEVSSAGTRVGQRGRAPDPRVNRLAASLSISMGRIRAQSLTAQRVRDTDLVLPMEQRHVRDIARLVAQEQAPANVQLLGSFDTTNVEPDIPDPYFGDASGFERVYERIDAALGPVVAALQRQLAADQSAS